MVFFFPDAKRKDWSACGAIKCLLPAAGWLLFGLKGGKQLYVFRDVKKCFLTDSNLLHVFGSAIFQYLSTTLFNLFLSCIASENINLASLGILICARASLTTS